MVFCGSKSHPKSLCGPARGSPQGITSPRPLPSRLNTSSGEREGQMPSAGGGTNTPRAPIQKLPAVEEPTKGAMGGSQRKDRPRQRPLQDLGALRRRKVQQIDPRLPGDDGCWKDSEHNQNSLMPYPYRTPSTGPGPASIQNNNLPPLSPGRQRARRPHHYPSRPTPLHTQYSSRSSPLPLRFPLPLRLIV